MTKGAGAASVWVLFCFAANIALADDSPRQVAAIPTLVLQRNQAMDALALCAGDLSTLQARVAEMESRAKRDADKIVDLTRQLEVKGESK